jgi:dTDP-L-rhamnose 4-epimerase
MLNKTILITGGAGFIGRHLSEALLKEGFAVRILDPLASQIHGEVPTNIGWLSNEKIVFYRTSITNRRELTKALEGADAVVNLAAETGTGQSMYEIARYNEVNSQGTALLFDILANSPARTVQKIVLASSRSVYGEGAYTCTHCDKQQDRQYPSPRLRQQLDKATWEHQCPTCQYELQAVATRETDKIDPASIYAATKYAQEQLTQIACSTLGIDFAILRLQNVYGEGQSLLNPYTGILSVFSTLIRRGKEIPLFEDGEESRDFVHVSDVVEAMRLCLNYHGSLSNVMNVGSGVASSVQTVAEKLNRALSGTSQLKVTGQFRLGDIRHNFADIQILATKLKFEPKIDLENGLKRFSKWVLTQPLPEDLLDKANAELRSRKMMK